MTATATAQTVQETAPMESDPITQARAIKADIDKACYHLEILQRREDKANAKLDSLEEQLLKEIDWKQRINIKQQIHEHSEGLQGLGIMRRDLERKLEELPNRLSALLMPWIDGVALPALHVPYEACQAELEAATARRDAALQQIEWVKGIRGDVQMMASTGQPPSWTANYTLRLWPDLERVIERLAELADEEGG